MFVALKPWDQRNDEKDKLYGVMRRYRKKMSDLKEASIIPIAPPAVNGLGATGGFTFELLQTTSTDSIQQFERSCSSLRGGGK
jgi:HAE1 family hydrophobic/amphiphilic exporter-1